MEIFRQFLDMGMDHILDIEGYDHILFIIVMCCVYLPKEWKRILILVTAFTIGHSITLALSGFKIVHANRDTVEFLIIVTILLTAIWNIIQFLKNKERSQSIISEYMTITFFGFIHGLGFSNFFRMLVGKNSDITLQLFGFNIGVEIGQIIIVFIFMLLAYFALNILKVKQKWWVFGVSGIAAILSLYLLSQCDFIQDFLSN